LPARARWIPGKGIYRFGLEIGTGRILGRGLGEKVKSEWDREKPAGGIQDLEIRSLGSVEKVHGL
jgi:hypothetical protein